MTKKAELPSFDKLVSEAKKFEHERKKKKKTLSASAKARTRGLTCSLVKQIVNDKNYKVLQGTRVPHHIHVFSRLEVCHACREESHTVQRITVVEEDRAGNHYLSTELDINSYAMLEFQRKELPIKFTTHDKIIPACHACICDMAIKREKRA